MGSRLDEQAKEWSQPLSGLFCDEAKLGIHFLPSISLELHGRKLNDAGKKIINFKEKLSVGYFEYPS